MAKAYLILEDQTIFSGFSFGAKQKAKGELVFSTNMIGSTESLTDPNFYGQIVVFSYPQLGNCGINWEDRESEQINLRGVIVQEYCEQPSNFRCQQKIDDFLKEQGVMGIYGIDTRSLVQKIREQGTMNALISPDLDFSPEEIESYLTQNAVANSSTPQKKILYPEGESRYSLALIDYGVKQSLINNLLRQGWQLTIYPYNTPAEELQNYDGIILSNGPGDPQANLFCLEQIKKLYGQLPILAVGLGHQMLALATGAQIVKMKFGHRGSNQPVKDLKTGRVLITNQNHGYTVWSERLKKGQIRFQNLNDGNCEGLEYPQKALSTQFIPSDGYGWNQAENILGEFAQILAESGRIN